MADPHIGFVISAYAAAAIVIAAMIGAVAVEWHEKPHSYN
jgi:hypothetical protein